MVQTMFMCNCATFHDISTKNKIFAMEGSKLIGTAVVNLYVQNTKSWIFGKPIHPKCKLYISNLQKKAKKITAHELRICPG